MLHVVIREDFLWQEGFYAFIIRKDNVPLHVGIVLGADAALHYYLFQP
jgi:hypothetical protein